ncbi:MAG: carbon-nitrogen hydrolase family protein [Anaerolineae bacterium]
MSTLSIALLHLAPRLGDLAYNRQLVEAAVTTAAGLGAEWVLTPELCLCGYQFTRRIGTDWIVPQPDPWMAQFCQVVARLRVTVFLSHPERDRHTDKLYNTVFVIAPDGTVIGTHRKVHVVPEAEAWASPGDHVVPVLVPPVNVGILICADVYTPGIARRLQAQGAQLLVSPAAWAPRPHGPDGAWEQRTRETGLPLFVCNRTGTDDTLSFVEAESVVVKDGKRLLGFCAPYSTLLIVDWNLQSQELGGQAYQRVEL